MVSYMIGLLEKLLDSWLKKLSGFYFPINYLYIKPRGAVQNDNWGSSTRHSSISLGKLHENDDPTF